MFYSLKKGLPQYKSPPILIAVLPSENPLLHDYSITVLSYYVLEEYFQRYEPAHISKSHMHPQHILGTVLREISPVEKPSQLTTPSAHPPPTPSTSSQPRRQTRSRPAPTTEEPQTALPHSPSRRTRPRSPNRSATPFHSKYRRHRW